MRILQITSHVNVGGITSHLMALGGALIQRGHQVVVASGGGGMESRLRALGIEPWQASLHTSREFGPQVFWAGRRLLARLGQEPVDLLHAHTRVGQVVADRLSRRLGIPYVATWHGFYRLNLGRRLWPCVGHRTIAISEPVRRHVIDEYHVPPRQIRLIPHGIEVERTAVLHDPSAQQRLCERLGLAGDGPIVGTMTRLVASKGVDQLIQALARIRAAVPAARLLIIGDGEERRRLERLAADQRLSGAVHFAGAVPDPRPALALMDVFVFLPATREGFGLSLLDAMAGARPIVAVRQGDGAPWVLDQSGVAELVEPGRPAALAEAVTRLLQDPAAARRAGERAQAVVRERFTLDRMVAAVEAVYAELLHRVA
jgi:glycosyltransferase involved in cell wall biosynthesis